MSTIAKIFGDGMLRMFGQFRNRESRAASKLGLLRLAELEQPIIQSKGQAWLDRLYLENGLDPELKDKWTTHRPMTALLEKQLSHLGLTPQSSGGATESSKDKLIEFSATASAGGSIPDDAERAYEAARQQVGLTREQADKLRSGKVTLRAAPAKPTEQTKVVGPSADIIEFIRQHAPQTLPAHLQNMNTTQNPTPTVPVTEQIKNAERQIENTLGQSHLHKLYQAHGVSPYGGDPHSLQRKLEILLPEQNRLNREGIPARMPTDRLVAMVCYSHHKRDQDLRGRTNGEEQLRELAAKQLWIDGGNCPGLETDFAKLEAKHGPRPSFIGFRRAMAANYQQRIDDFLSGNIKR